MAVPAVAITVEVESVMEGGPRALTVRENVLVASGEMALRAVIVYSVALAAVSGVPESKPVVVLKLKVPLLIAGEIA